MSDAPNRLVARDGGNEARDEQQDRKNRDHRHCGRRIGFLAVARDSAILGGVYSALVLLFYLGLVGDNLRAVAVMFLIWLPLLLTDAIFLGVVTFHWGFLGSAATALAFWFFAIPCYLLFVSSFQGEFEGGIAMLSLMIGTCGGSVVLGLISGVVLAILHDID